MLFLKPLATAPSGEPCEVQDNVYITAVTIENFKGIRDPARVELRPVTLLFGPNSAGKSTVVQALHYAHEVLERHNVDPGKTLIGGEAIELGGFETLVHGHQRHRTLRLRLDLGFDSGADLPEYSLPYANAQSDIEVSVFRELVSGWVHLSVSWSDLLQAPVVEKYEVGLNSILFATIDASRDLKNIAVTYLNLSHPIVRSYEATESTGSELVDFGSSLLRNIRVEGTASIASFGLWGQRDALPLWGKPLWIQREVFKDNFDNLNMQEFVLAISRLIVGPGELARNCLNALRYVGPLRQVPPRNFEAVRSPDESRWATGLGAWDIIAKADSMLIETVNQWLTRGDRLDTGYKIAVRHYKEVDVDGPLMLAIRQRRAIDEDDPVYTDIEAAPTRARITLRDESTGLEVFPQDVGIGLSQMIPVIVASVARPGLVAIEQPELHIHPAWQVVLGDLFLSQAQDTSAQFLIETHSEHLVLRIMRRMRETFSNSTPPGMPKAQPKDVAVYYVEVDEDQTIIREMALNEAGELIKAWPGGFFEEGLREQIGDAQ